MSAKLRVGVLLDSTVLHAWERVMLDRIESSDYAELAVIILRKPTAHMGCNIEPRPQWPTLLYDWAAQLLQRACRRLERGICCEHDAFATVEGRNLLARIPTLGMGATDHDGTVPQDVKRIHALNLDAIVNLTSQAFSAKLSTAAKHGVWCLDSADYPRRGGAPPGFWEVYFGRPVTRMHLTSSGEKGEQHILACSAAGTHPLSVKLNRSNAYWNALSLVPRQLAHLHSRGGAALHTAHRSSAVAANRDSESLAPDVSALATYIFRNVKRRATERLRRTLNIEQWILLFHLGDDLCTSIREFQRLVPPIDRYWADPHVLYRDGKFYVFIEEYLLATEKGYISVIAIDKEGRAEEPIKVLEQPYHLSYPFVFEHAGDLYMVPESMENGTVSLYRCVEFPSKWEFIKNLLDNIRAVDSTLLHHEGKWWLFANVVENKGGSASEELFVFYTDCLLTGTWDAHALNPVVSDVATARPAGGIQQKQGKLYRPAQDCSVRYGYAIKIKEITALSPDEYAETEVARIAPDWDKNILATHTLGYAPGLTVVDALLDRRRFGHHH